MNQSEIDSLLKQTLTDARLSQSEKKGLLDWLATHANDDNQRALVRSRIFALARSELAAHPESLAVLGWLEDVVKLTVRSAPGDAQPLEESHAFFSPGDGPLREIQHQLGQAKQTADLCVFTITDDRIADAIVNAHKRGLKVRIITDNDKAHDLGSDIERFQSAGIPVRIDHSPYHMHHKYAVFDSRRLLTGSYNWTRGAAQDNEENIIVTSDPHLLAAFVRHFESLWDRLK